MSHATVTIDRREYDWLRAMHAELVAFRDARKGTPHPLKDWHRFPPELRLKVVEIELNYKDPK